MNHKCKGHTTTLVCLECALEKANEYKKLLDFVKESANLFGCDCLDKQSAKKLLKEIGEFK